MTDVTCPSCDEPLHRAGYTERCKGCDGAWIHEDALVGMLQERASTTVALPWQPREDGPDDRPRPCAVCREPMQRVNLGTVALDRCPVHGVWFDARELAALLAEAKTFVSHEHTQRHRILHAIAKLISGGN